MPDHSADELARRLAELRDIDGFPVGEDDAILSLSLPPAYTACPNPFIKDRLGEYPETDDDWRPDGALAADVSEGRSDPIYKGQVYHTKVPPAAIAQHIEHYCPPGGVVFDGFCGSGMTGVAARMTGRPCLLTDLSPAATAIAATFCVPFDQDEARGCVKRLVRFLHDECDHLYEVARAPLDYVIWSEVYRCPQCRDESPFSDMGFDFSARRPTKRIICPACDEELTPRQLERCLDESGRTLEVPVRARDVGGRSVPEREVTDADLKLIRRVDEAPIPYPYPDDWMMDQPPDGDGWGDMWRRGYHVGVLRVSDFYYKRTLWVLAAALQFIDGLDCSRPVRHFLRVTVINTSINLTRMRRAYQGVIPLVLYFPRLRRECNAIATLERRLHTSLRATQGLPERSQVTISTQSGTDLRNIPDASVDYIFTDPPFGGNIIYSEVNFLWESWLGVKTNQQPEAILSRTQEKGLPEYEALMSACLDEAHRILKPGRWITVEFHNSDNRVWAAIQAALDSAGFVVADVRILDKQMQAFKAGVSESAVKHDLVISAFKPDANWEPPSASEDAPAADIWEFITQRLAQLPVPTRAGSVDPERGRYLLFGRMVAYCVLHSRPVPMGSAEFYRELKRRFVEREGMYFVPGRPQDDDLGRTSEKRQRRDGRPTRPRRERPRDHG